MVKILILLVCLSVAPSTFGRTTRHSNTQADIKQMEGALEWFHLDHRRYPTQQEGLLALTPYLRDLRVNDPWGRPYIYRIPGLHQTNSFDLYSLGEDGKSKSGGADWDDINHWDSGKFVRQSRLRTKLTLAALGGLVLLITVWLTTSFFVTRANDPRANLPSV